MISVDLTTFFVKMVSSEGASFCKKKNWSQVLGTEYHCDHVAGCFCYANKKGAVNLSDLLWAPLKVAEIYRYTRSSYC